MLAFLEEKD